MSTIQVTIAPRVKTTTVLRTGATGLPGEVGAVGQQGPQGIQGPPGSDASVTSGNITSALGFAPIGDAPSNGTEYARKNGAWSPVSTSAPEWSAITGKPSTFAPAAHQHPISDVTGLQSELDGKQTAGSYAPATGISPSAITGTAVITTDIRLSDARTPTAHKSTHATGGSDALTAADIGAASLGQSIAFALALS